MLWTHLFLLYMVRPVKLATKNYYSIRKDPCIVMHYDLQYSLVWGVSVTHYANKWSVIVSGIFGDLWPCVGNNEIVSLSWVHPWHCMSIVCMKFVCDGVIVIVVIPTIQILEPHTPVWASRLYKYQASACGIVWWGAQGLEEPEGHLPGYTYVRK